MPSSNRFDQDVKPSRATRAVAAALVATAVAASGAAIAGAATSTEAGGFKGMGVIGGQ